MFVGFNLQLFPCLSFPPSFPMKKALPESRLGSHVHHAIVELRWLSSGTNPCAQRCALGTVEHPLRHRSSAQRNAILGQISKVERGDSWWFMVIPHILLWLSSHVLVSIWSEMTWPYFLNKTGNGKESWSVPLHTTAKPRDQAGCFSQHAPFILMLFGRTKRCHPKKYKTVWPMPQVSGKCVEKTIIWRLFRPTDPPQRVPTCPNISSCPLALGVTGAPACQLMFKKPTSR